MSDLLDELAKIKEAEKQGEKIVFEAKRRAEKSLASARGDLEIMAKASDKEVAVARLDIENNYKKTTNLMLAKLRDDHETKLKLVRSLAVQKIAVAYEPEILKYIEDYGHSTPEATK